MSYGMLLSTTNGGTVWRNKPLFFSWDVAYHTCMVSDSKLVSNLYSQKIPGFLFDVQSDGSGKHVFAVGGNRYSAASIATATPFAVGWQMDGVATILYSGDRGNTWRARPPSLPPSNGNAPPSSSALRLTRPALPLPPPPRRRVFQSPPIRTTASSPTFVDFAFTAVAVQKGTTAWAVGGCLQASFNGASYPGGVFTPDTPAGMIVGTVNGGFSWQEMARSLGPRPPISTPPNAPALNGRERP